MAQRGTLIVSQPGRKTLRVELPDGTTSIGRAHGNTVRLKYDRNVSRHHAEIRQRDEEYWLSDLTTRNGTTVNDSLVVSEQKLVNGDLICFGGASTIEFCLPEKQEDKDTNGAPGKKEDESANSLDAVVVTEPQQPRRTFATTMLGLVGGLAVIALIGGILFATGRVSRKESQKHVAEKEEPTPSPLSSSDEDVATPSPTVESGSREDNIIETPSGTDSKFNIEAGAQILAAKISTKNYKFDPEFTALINVYVNEYKSSPGYYSRARKYRDVIDKEFLNVQGLPPVFAYVMAMSRTKFVESNDDVWDLPGPIRKGEGVNPTETSGTTKIAASYIRGLWDVFGKEGFIYAVACYGMPLDEAGKIQQQLELKDPNAQGRYDFWKMKSMGVVKGEQIERVARFFAAGIVMENPQQFGLNEPPLSTLY